MAKFNVYSPDGQTIKYSGAPTYHGTYLKPSYLEFTTISSPTAISWSIGDYIVYSRTGLTYRLYDIPQPTKKATSGASGESFVYSNVQFYADTKKLEVVPFRDLVIDQGQTTAYHFSTLNSVDTFENVAGICARIQKNMENFYGNGTWSFVVASGLVGFNETEAREFSVSGGTCLSALEKIYEVWPELGWAYSLVNGVHTITVGAPNVRTSDNTTNLYQYGKDNGLTMIKKTQQNKDEFCTRLFAYGSSRNMINRYYNGKDIYEAASVYIPNLMIPSSFWGTSGLPPKPDASKAYIDNLIAQASYGIIPKIVYFDGNEQKEVYPSITETTIAMLKAAKTALGKTDPGKPDYFPQDADGTHRLDEIIGVPSPITDNGDTSNSGQKYIVDETSAISSGMHSGSATPEGPLAIIEFDLDAYNFATGGEVIIKPTTTLTIDANSPDQLSVSASIVVGSTPRIAENIAVTEVSTGTYTCTLPELKTGDVNNPASGNVKYHISVRARWEEISTSQLVTVNNDASSISWRAKKILIKTFKLKLRQIGFDVMERAALSGNGNPTIAFKDGKCIAKSFSIKSATYNSSDDTWTLTVYRGIDTSISMMYPNSTYPVAVGDHFVLLDLAMPDEYIEMASVKLKNEADALLAKLSKIEPFYEPSVDAKVVANNIASHPSTESYILREGKYMHITDADVVGVDEYVIIDTLTINENESSIPTYKVTLREKKKESYTQSIENAIQSLQSTGSTSLSSSQSSSLPIASVTTLGGIKVGANLSIDTDGVLSSLGGGVTSVDMTVPTGMTIGGNPITTRGTLALGLAEGYNFLTDTYKATLDGHLADRSSNPHNVTLAQAAGQALADKLTALASWFEYDENNHAIRVKEYIGESQVKTSFYAYGEVTAGGIGSGGGGGGAAIWGAITGTLSNQTDLMAALNGKASASHTHTIGNITGLQDALDAKQALITSSNKLAYSLISGTPDLSVYATTSALSAHTGDTTIHITASERSTWNGKQNALGYTPVNKAGDTMSGTLTIASGADAKIILDNTDTETKYQQIVFKQSGTEYARLGTYGDNVLKYGIEGVNDNIIYHSGNCNNASTLWTAGGLQINGNTMVGGSGGLEIWRTSTSGNAIIQAYDRGVTNAYFPLHIDASTLSLNAGGGGNVGIGTTSPQYKLHVNGSIYTDSLILNGGIYGATNITASGIIQETGFKYADYNISSGAGWYRFAEINYGQYSADFWISNGYNYMSSTSLHIQVCCGYASDVVINVIKGGYSVFSKVRAVLLSGHKWGIEFYFNSPAETIGIRALGLPSLVLNTSATAGSSGATMTEVDVTQGMSIYGNITATGEVTAGSSSDARFKDNQSALRNANAVLSALKPMEFDWNALYHSLGGMNEGHDVGFLAQDVQPLIPSAIGKVYGDYLRLDYNKVTPYLVAGWQSHETEIDRLKRRVRELENRIAQLS